MRDPSDYFYLYFISFISISSLIIWILNDGDAKKEIKDMIIWIKNKFGGKK